MKNIILTVAAATLFMVAGCEKGIDTLDIDNTVYLPVSGYVEAAPLLGESVYYMTVYKAGVEKSPAITVSLNVAEEQFEEFKASNTQYADLELLPEEYYSLATTSLQIPENSYMAYLEINMKNIDAEFRNTNYVLPIAISGVSKGVVSEDKSIVYLHFGSYANMYAGVYDAKGLSVDDNGTEVNIGGQKILTTSGQRKVNTWVSTDTGKIMELTLNTDGTVTIQSAEGMEQFKIANDPTLPSTFEGEFDPTYQRFRGSMTLAYTYEVTQSVSDIVTTTMYNVSETLDFTL
jgi:hypothetical protein